MLWLIMWKEWSNLECLKSKMWFLQHIAGIPFDISIGHGAIFYRDQQTVSIICNNKKPNGSEGVTDCGDGCNIFQLNYMHNNLICFDKVA